MTKRSIQQVFLALAAAAVSAVTAACADRGISEPQTPSPATSTLSVGKTLIECPAATSETGVGVVTPLGGVVTAGGTVVTVPAGAVLVPTTIEVTVPASPYMEVDLTVPGIEHFVFEQPVAVSISYARCTRNDINSTPISAWYIDSESKALLENMGGVDDKLNRRVTFVTPHFSGYALAN
jgi:hypothetical protein